MLRIEKNKEPQEFINWKEKFKHIKGREPNYVDLSLPENADIKLCVKQSLMKEQHNLCCYCCAQLVEGRTHIEHFRPRDKYPQLSLNYNNLHVSCNGKDGDSCGHKKENWFEEGVTLSPLLPDIEENFTYLQNGAIEAKDNDKGVMMNISKLSLQEQRLKIARKATLDASLIMTAESAKELEVLLDDLNDMYSEEDGSVLCPFYNIVKYFAKQMEQIL